MKEDEKIERDPLKTKLDFHKLHIDGREEDEIGSKRFTLTDNDSGQSVEIVAEGSMICAKQFESLNIIVYDPGLRRTAACKSAISYVDGENGRLLYRGYSIEDLVQHCTYTEVAFLLINGNLPTEREAKLWRRQVMTHTYLHVKMEDLMRAFNYDAHPMGMFISAMAALSTFHPDANPSLVKTNLFLGNDENALEARSKQIFRILGKATTVAANAYRHRIGRAFNQPQNSMGYAENFLYMLDALGDNTEGFRPHPVLVNALDKMFIVHAEHEMNCSTTAMHTIASTMVDPYSAIAGAAAALYGPSHGGACEGVLRMLERIGTIEEVPAFIEGVKRKETRLIGFGHRVYRSYDPRALILRELSRKVFAICGGPSPLLEVALELEKTALADDYFVSRKLYPNVDFYSGLIYQAMGFPTDFFPLLFAIPRISGWLAHWCEMMSADDSNPLEGPTKTAVPIWRPTQVYVGEPERGIKTNPNLIGDVSSKFHYNNQVHPTYRRYVISRAAMNPSPVNNHPLPDE